MTDWLQQNPAILVGVLLLARVALGMDWGIRAKRKRRKGAISSPIVLTPATTPTKGIMVMTASVEVLEERIANLQAAFDAQAARVKFLESELKSFEEEMTDRERKRLLWGISTLGSVTLALGGILWSYRSVIFK